MMFPKFIFIFFLGSFNWESVTAYSVICESSGFCQKSEDQCRPDSFRKCFPESELIVQHNKYASYEPSGQQENTEITSSSGRACLSPAGVTNISLQDIQIAYISINPTYFSICISWTLANHSGYYGGLEVRVLGLHHRIEYRYCVTHAQKTKMCINNFRYDTLRHFQAVEVLSYPLALDDNEDASKMSKQLRSDIEGCADIEHKGTACNLKQLSIPRNLVVVSAICEDFTKMLKVSWEHPVVFNDTLFSVDYYISVYKERVILYNYKVQTSLQIELYNLSADCNYSVGVQAYLECAGLGDFGTTGNDKLGCGRRKVQKEYFMGYRTCFLEDERTTVEVRETHVVEVSDGSNANSILLVSVFCSIVFVIGISMLIISFFLLLRYCNKKLRGFVHPQKSLNPCKVFVFCSPSMSQASLEYVQKNVICSLLEYFDIVMLSDLSSGNVSMWLEESINSVDSILIVGNQDLCHDWETKERSALLNSLELIVSAAVSQNTIGKFCIISIADSLGDVSVPNNSYLKLMPIFLMGQKKFEIEKLYQFVTKSRGIEFSSETP